MTSPAALNKQAFTAASKVLVGGVNSPVRSFKSVGGVPVFFERGDGQYLYDIAGKRYVDYVLSWGALILGHAYPPVVTAVKQTLANGTSFGAPTRIETQLAEAVIACVPFMEKVRMVNSGTEAVMALIRLARGFTGREKIVKFKGCYHGHGDSFLVAAGSGALTLGVPSSPGVTAGAARDTLLADFNDLSSVDKLFHAHGTEIAAILLEPVTGNMGVIVPEDNFLADLKALAARYGALLIFDEVMTGFRLHLGGMSVRSGVTPDLLALGKIIGGGLPAALYGGRADIMHHVAPEGPVYQAGTLSGNPLAMASGLATLTELKTHHTRHYAYLEQLAKDLQAGLSALAQAQAVPVHITRLGSMLTVFFTAHPTMRTFADVATLDEKAYSIFFHAMLQAGNYLPPSPYEAWFLSISHTKADIATTLLHAKQAFTQVKHYWEQTYAKQS